MKKQIKILTLILSLILTFSMFAISAFANESQESVNEAINEATSNDIEINFSFDRFVDSLQYMWKGMLCIFIVIGAIILSIWGLNKAINSIDSKKNTNSNKEN